MADESSFLTPLLRELVYGIDAWKKPVKVVAASNVTQSGLRTVDGVALAAGDEVLCVGQSNGAQNGVWVVATGAWVRRFDATTSERLFEGTRVPVTRGTHAGEVYRLATTGKISVGTTAQVWELDGGGGGGGVTVEGSGEIAVVEDSGVYTVSSELLDSAAVGNEPDTLVVRGPNAEINGDRLVLGGGSAASTGYVSMPQNAAVYGRVSTSGGQDARMIALSGTSLRVGDQWTTPRIVAPSSGAVEFASGASDTVFARILSGAPTQVGDLSFRGNGRPRVYSQALGAAEDVLLRSDVFREYRHVWPEDSTLLSQGTEILSMPANVPLVLRRCMIFPTSNVPNDVGADFAVIALEVANGVDAPVTLASISSADSMWEELQFLPLTTAATTVAIGQRVQWTVYKEGAGKLLPKIFMFAEFMVDPSYSG
ncbi:hypothetical protein [Sorangium sp. So ce1024]|uniref:hypothetical protein n=1 Tax=Sorangium sp. So ce1024 TaxID=3133327 RepID=UPI003F0FA32A